ncbi:HNH endonuclease [Blastomonas fulva]|uniref:Restriction endonuclease n=1 Tax=Blastomonas fulva TaxID=1550728 RepID=A0ABN5B242_9SPHN|nr:HNH endonuclease [Blastomonas fulva]ASR50368.1 restriction endonuclease [Blastomonas fulva]
MTKGVLIYKADSDYNDDPTSQYQFPSKLYLSRATTLVGDWVVFLESRRGGKRGYFAAARIQSLAPDPKDPTRHLAVIEPGSFVEFDQHVPFSDTDGPLERALLRPDGTQSGGKQAAVRPISDADFNRIIERGLIDGDDLLPRHGEALPGRIENHLNEIATPFLHEIPRARTEILLSRAIRDRAFRRNVLAAYGERCALSGLKLLNGGGRAEVEAAHIKPVQHGGPDAVANGLALSGTAHWMFDRGLIALGDDHSIEISRYVNDVDSVAKFLLPNRRAAVPSNPAHRPHPHFLEWHRQNVFKS